MTMLLDKVDFPVHKARKYLEPGPVVLVSSAWQRESDIMTLGWHTILAFSPSLVGCMISGMNHSHELIKQSGECVINVPGADLIEKVVAIGNSHGDKVDKFKQYQLTSQPGKVTGAPLIGECFASFECRLYDDAMVANYNFFIFEIVSARVVDADATPATLHYTGEGKFSVMSDKIIDQSANFAPEMLI